MIEPSNEENTTRDGHTIRSMNLCVSFARNLAFYRATWRHVEHFRGSNFYRVLNGNFIDAAVLEWCKLMSTRRSDRHSWRRLVADEAERTAFAVEIAAAAQFNLSDFESYSATIFHYRDKAVAHLDHWEQIDIPDLEPAKLAVFACYERLRRDFFSDGVRSAVGTFPKTMQTAYEDWSQEADALSDRMVV